MKHQKWMRRTAWALALMMGTLVRAETDVAPTPPLPEWSGRLCVAIEEGVRLLEQHRLVPDEAKAQAALLEALIRAAEPAVEFLDEEGLAARTKRLAPREWETGLTVVEAEGLPQVAAVAPDSPAAAADILPGERIETIAGRELFSVDGLMFVREWLAAGEEATIEIGVRDADDTGRTVTLERVRRSATSGVEVEVLPADMGYLRVAGIYPGTGAEIASALENWHGTDIFGAILDLRGADGTAEEEVAVLAARFTPEGSLLYTKSDRQGRGGAKVHAPAAPVEALPLMVLIDEGTTGAAELLAAVLGGSVKGTMLIGRLTSGDPLIREPLKLSTGRYALLATRQIQTANGTVYSGAAGVRPDVPITEAALSEVLYEPETPVLRRGRTLSEEEKIDRALRDRTRNDTYLRRATDILLGLQALGYDRRR